MIIENNHHKIDTIKIIKKKKSKKFTFNKIKIKIKAHKD